jgi:hypothetical protein
MSIQRPSVHGVITTPHSTRYSTRCTPRLCWMTTAPTDFVPLPQIPAHHLIHIWQRSTDGFATHHPSLSFGTLSIVARGTAATISLPPTTCLCSPALACTVVLLHLCPPLPRMLSHSTYCPLSVCLPPFPIYFLALISLSVTISYINVVASPLSIIFTSLFDFYSFRARVSALGAWIHMEDGK